MTVELTEFLLARYDEDEQVALAAVGYESRVYWDWAMVRHCLRPASVVHYERHHPDRVLADIEAKRRIVAQSSGGEVDLGDYTDGYTDGIAWALRCLALPYADHPDYRREWRP